MKRFLIYFLFSAVFTHSGLNGGIDHAGIYLKHIEDAIGYSSFETGDQMKRLNQFFLNIHALEEAYPEYVSCVTAQDSLFYAYQVVARELFRKLYGREVREDFQFLRFPTEHFMKTKEELFSKYPSLIVSFEEAAREFKTTPEQLAETLNIQEIKDEQERLRIALGLGEDHRPNDSDSDSDDEDSDDETPDRYRINDSLPEVSRELISVNFSMETYRPLDTAMFVFLAGRSVSIGCASANDNEYTLAITKFLKTLFEPLSLPEEPLRKCLERLAREAPQTDLGIVTQIFLPRETLSDFLYMSFGAGFLHPYYDANLNESINAFQSDRQQDCFRTFRNFQGRIIAGSLTEDADVKIFCHTLIPEEQQRQYEQVVRESLDELLGKVESTPCIH